MVPKGANDTWETILDCVVRAMVLEIVVGRIWIIVVSWEGIGERVGDGSDDRGSRSRR